MNSPLQLSLLEIPRPRCSAPVWATLDDEHRALAVAMLARLMTRVIVAKLKTTVAVDRESSDTAKITADHLRRCALVYIRQSSAAQVENNRESTERQYKLVERAVELGWKRETIDIIDEDLGVSGSGLADRSGFASMATRVALGQIGIVLGIEVSRLARNNADWYRLLDLCGVTNTLIGDADGIYHPGLFNDRLLLGLKGTMSEAELQIPPKDMCQCSRPRTSSVSRDRQCCSV